MLSQRLLDVLGFRSPAHRLAVFHPQRCRGEPGQVQHVHVLQLPGRLPMNRVIDISDLCLLATNWQAGVCVPLRPSLDDALASVGLSAASVPESALASV